jgi:hypothetical protein
MKARQWIEIAAVASAAALCNAAIANDLARTPGGADASVSSAVHEALAERNDMRGSAAALPQDQPTNAAMNRAAELGTSVPGAPLASSAEGVDAGTASSRDDTPYDTANDEGSAPRTSDATSRSGSATLSNEGAASTRATTNGKSAAPANAATSDERSTPQGETDSAASDRGASASGSASGSESFDAWANDYAARHDGHITRQQFLDEMGSRFDRLDSQHQGYLTPYEVEEIVIFAPADTTSGPGETGSANTQ